MKTKIYEAAEKGKVEFLDKDVEAGGVTIYSDDDLLGLTSHGNNIIHVAAECGQEKFIEKALASIPALLTTDVICGKNKDGDTPLHLAAKQETATIAQHLIRAYNHSQWRIRNNQGNTPLHVALMNGGKCIRVAEYLLKTGSEVASYVNHREQSPLHLAVNYDNQGAKTSMTNVINKLNSSGASLDYKKRPFEEDSLSLIKSLYTDTTVCCLRDEDGMTPLLRAAFKSYVPAVTDIINFCPECVEICDLRGKNVLHHSKFLTFAQAMELLKRPCIRVLMDRQDENGNTPLHLAIKNYDYNMVKAMIEWNANFAIEDKEGTSPATLIQSKSSDFLNKMKDDFRQCNNIEHEAMMPKGLLDDVYGGNWKFLLKKLDEDPPEQFQFRLPDGSNILHVVMQYHDYSTEREDLIVEIPKKYPILLCQTDSRGCTPLHYAMPNFSRITFEKRLGNLIQMKEQYSNFLLPPWEAKDLHGDTILHVAIRYKRFTIAKSLINITNKKLVGETNDLKETPLHCLCRYSQLTIGKDFEMVDLLMNDAVVHSYDAAGLTPLFRAVNSGSISIAEKILHQYPQLKNQVDSNGRNMLHHISIESYEISKEQRDFMKFPWMNFLLYKVDGEGNLPIHVALQNRRFRTAKLLIERYLALEDKESWKKIKNNDGNVWIDLVRDPPSSFTEFLSSSMGILPVVINVHIGKSFYGVTYSNMKNFMDTLGVVAALFATITFTAALTVPGGFMTDKGTPIFAKEVAFQVFMFADVVGMCSSIMALFCIVLFYTSDQMESEGRKLGDLSMGLLRLSFVATLVAFMTVVYVTAFPVVTWLAIFTLVISSLVLLLMMRKTTVVDPLIQVLYFIVIFSIKDPINSWKTYFKFS